MAPRASARGGPRGAFTPDGSAHAFTSSSPRPSSAQPTVESLRRLARGGTRSGDLRCSTLRRACAVVGRHRWCGCGSPPALPLTAGGLSHAAGAEGRTREAEDTRTARAETPSRRTRARTGRSRFVLARRFVRLQKSLDSAGRREADAPTSPDLEASGDGRPSTWLARKRGAAGEAALCSESKRKLT